MSHRQPLYMIPKVSFECCYRRYSWTRAPEISPQEEKTVWWWTASHIYSSLVSCKIAFSISDSFLPRCVFCAVLYRLEVVSISEDCRFLISYWDLSTTSNIVWKLISPSVKTSFTINKFKIASKTNLTVSWCPFSSNVNVEGPPIKTLCVSNQVRMVEKKISDVLLGVYGTILNLLSDNMTAGVRVLGEWRKPLSTSSFSE